MRIDTKDPAKLWELYEEGKGYKSRLNLYRTVDVNEQMYAGNQWFGLNAPDIDKPVVNIIRPPVNYMAATIGADDVAIDIAPAFPSSEDERYLDAVTTELLRTREQNDMDTLNRQSIIDAAVDGDVGLYHYWDADVKTGQQVSGDVRMHLVENTNVIFGNPAQRDPQRQPYIVIVMRDYIADVIDEAVANGMREEEARDKIKPDNSNLYTNEMTDKLVTKLLTFRKDDGKILATISTAEAIIREEWDTGLTLYPVAWFSWQRSRSSYHGVSVVTEMVPTQIYVNKMVAYLLRCTSMYAWPKIIFDGTKIPRWDNRLGANIKVNGNPNDAYAAIFPGTGASADVSGVLDWIMGRIKEASGANDAAIGQIKSDNTSAIIAAQEANTIPLDLVQRAFYSFQEQSIRITLDLLRANAGTRYVALSEDELAAQQKMDAAAIMPGTEGMGNMMPDELTSPVLDSAESIGTPNDIAGAPEGTKPIDFGKLGDMAWQLNVSAGKGSRFSEAIQNATLGNLLQMGLITGLEYMERVAEKYVPNKQGIIDRMKAEEAQMPPPDDYDDGGGYDYSGEDIAAEQGVPEVGEPSSVQRAKKMIMGMRPQL